MSSASYAGGLVALAMLLVMMTFRFATTAISPSVDDVVSTVFVVWFWNATWVFAPPMIAFTLGASIVVVRYSALPKWIGWLGFTIALILLMPWFGMILGLPWIVIVSLSLTYRAWGKKNSVSPT